ncbi:MAG: phage tail protein [Rhizobiaceae bacterium]|nr:phage tail protein [Rhizobiaceae bacterium]
MSLTSHWADTAGLQKFDNALKSLGDKRMRQVANRVVNRAGNQTKTQVTRALTKQTGLKRRTIVKAIKVKRSGWSDPSYRMTTTGGDVALKYFNARETRRGVSARPFGQRKVFASTFIKGGRFPDRVGLGMGGHVFEREGARRMPINKIKSGVIIPAEMVKGETATAFNKTASRVLMTRMSHELSRATGGVLS